MKYLNSIKIFVSTIVLALVVSSCKKCHPKGDEILNEKFDTQGEWSLITDISDTAEIYSKVEDGLLKLKTEQGNYNCQRASYYFTNDLSAIKGFELCIYINELVLPKGQKLHLYVSLGDWELHATCEKKDIKNKVFFLALDEKGTHGNLKGSLNGKIGYKEEGDDYSTNFIQISLCPDDTIESEGEMYLEIDKIEITTL